jgi:hypothetical protein
LPASASPAGFIFTPIGWNCKPQSHESGGIFDRNYAGFSAGIDRPLDLPPGRPARPAQIATGSYHGYARLFEEHILQADQGCDFDFLLR